MNPIRVTILAVAMLVPLAPVQAATPAEALAARVPPGSVTTRDDVARAREAARATEAAADATWAVDQERCWRNFFATACRDKARRTHLEAKREVRRVIAESGEVERRLDAQARAAARAEAQRTAPSPEQVAAREATARADYEARLERAREAADDRRQRDIEAEQRRALLDQRQGEAQQRDAQRTQRAATETESARRFEQKQLEAQEYARRKAQERAENERRRAERQREREKTMIEQGRAPPVSSPAAAPGRSDAAAPRVDLPTDIPPPPVLVDDKPAQAPKK